MSTIVPGSAVPVESPSAKDFAAAPSPAHDGDKSGAAAQSSHAKPHAGIQPPASGGRNLVAIARPYFGLIVLTTLLLTAWGLVAMFRMPSGIYPEVSFPQIAVIVETPALGIRDVEITVTRPVEERVSIVPGVSRLQSKTVRGATDIKIDFAREPTWFRR